MAATAIYAAVGTGKSLIGRFQVTGRATLMVNLGNRAGNMAAEAGVVIDLQVFVMRHHVSFIPLIVALFTVDQPALTLLIGGMTASARGGLLIIFRLLMAGGAIPAMKFAQLTMFEFFGRKRIVTLLTTDCHLGAEQCVMTGGACIGILTVSAMVEQDIAGGVTQVISIRCRRCLIFHETD